MKLRSDRYYLLKVIGDGLSASPKLFFIWRMTKNKAIGAWVSTKWETPNDGLDKPQIVPDWDEETELVREDIKAAYPVTLEMLRECLTAMENDKRIAAAKPGQSVEAAGISDVPHDPRALGPRSHGKRRAVQAKQIDGDATMNTLMIPIEREVWDWCRDAGRDAEADDGSVIGSVKTLLTVPAIIEQARPVLAWRALLHCLQKKGLLRSKGMLLELGTDDYEVPAEAVRAVLGTDAILQHADKIVTEPKPGPLQVATSAQAGESRGKAPRKAEPVEFLQTPQCGMDCRVFIRAAHTLGVTRDAIVAYLQAHGPQPSKHVVGKEIWRLTSGKAKLPEGVDFAAIRSALGLSSCAK